MTPRDRIITAVDQRRAEVLEVIRNARHSLSLSLFRANDEEIFEELTRATKRGVQVEALITSRAKGGKKRLKKLWTDLERTGATVHPYTEPVVKYHAKYLVADDGPALVASFNFTRKCFRKTVDAMVITYDPDVVAGLKALIAADRERAPLPAGLTSRLIVGPELARQQYISLFAQARASIRLIDAKVSDPDLVTLLNARRATGLTVEVYASRRIGNLKSHGKLLLIDDRLAVIGGLALTAISLGFRREVAIMVDEPEAVAEMQRLFQTIDAAPATGRIGAVGGTEVLL